MNTLYVHNCHHISLRLSLYCTMKVNIWIRSKHMIAVFDRFFHILRALSISLLIKSFFFRGTHCSRPTTTWSTWPWWAGSLATCRLTLCARPRPPTSRRAGWPGTGPCRRPSTPRSTVGLCRNIVGAAQARSRARRRPWCSTWWPGCWSTTRTLGSRCTRAWSTRSLIGSPPTTSSRTSQNISFAFKYSAQHYRVDLAKRT